MAMAGEGAAGKTAEELTRVLHMDDAARAGEAELQARLRAPGNHGFELAAANRLWVDRAAKLSPDYQKQIVAMFKGDEETLDFADPASAASRINAWVSEQTHKRIPQIVTPNVLGRGTSVVLTNALYFKGNWDKQFKRSQTTEEDFHTAPGKTMRAMMMSQREEHDYADIDADGNVPAFRALSMKYAGGELSMLLLLPELGQLDKLETALSIELLRKVDDRLHEVHLPVTLPRFKLEDSFALADVLKAMGVKAAFDPAAADFSKMSPEVRIYLSAVLHRTFVEVNEEGTEAAAATAVVGKAMAMPGRMPEFKADHPFLFLIRDNGSGAILFFGRVAEPR
jgi:serpin B